MATSSQLLPRHPLRFVIGRTGLSADVLRAWEKRYQAVTPSRSAGGQRLYSDDDLDRLTLLQQVTGHGRNISQVARLGADELRALLVGDAQAAPAPGPDQGAAGNAELLARMIAATKQLDGAELERLLRRGTIQLGAAASIEQLIVPFLHDIGVRWHRSELNPAHEHLATAVVQRALHWVLEGTNPPPDAPRIVVASLEGERHEIGLHIVAAVASGAEWRVVFLGGDLPIETIANATLQAGARVLAISAVSANSNAAIVTEVAALRKLLGPAVAVLIGGAAAPQFRAELTALGAHVLGNLDQLRAFLRTYQSA